MTCVERQLHKEVEIIYSHKGRVKLPGSGRREEEHSSLVTEVKHRAVKHNYEKERVDRKARESSLNKTLE